jgi:putative nucleotide binding protein
MKNRDYKSRRNKRRKKTPYFDLKDAIILDFYPQGKSFSRRSSEDYNPLAITVTTEWFRFFDVILVPGTIFSVNDHIKLTNKNKRILKLKELQFNQLSSSALENLPHTIKEIVRTNESRFISFLNQAHPLTTQMHQLQLLPGIGHKRMWKVLETRKSRPFTSFSDFTERTGISDPGTMFHNRILIELEESPKYRLFTKKMNDQG